MSFTNVYYKRTTGTERPCFVCYKATTTVLATTNAVDFIYTCDSHLNDRNFASLIQPEPPAAQPAAVSAEEIAKVKEEWEAQEKARKEKAKAKADKKADDKEKNSKETKSSTPKPSTPISTPSSPPPPPQQGSHQKYALHRDFYAMRQYEHKKKRQAGQAKALAPRLPGTPRTAPTG